MRFALKVHTRQGTNPRHVCVVTFPAVADFPAAVVEFMGLPPVMLPDMLEVASQDMRRYVDNPEGWHQERLPTLEVKRTRARGMRYLVVLGEAADAQITASLRAGTPASEIARRVGVPTRYVSRVRRTIPPKELPVLRNTRKLSDAQVQDICDRYAKGGVTYDDLAREYGVTRQAISLFILGRNRRHIDRSALQSPRPARYYHHQMVAGRTKRVRLTEEEIAGIGFLLEQGVDRQEICTHYALKDHTLRLLEQERFNLPSRSRKSALADDDVRAIYAAAWNGEKVAALAARYGVSQAVISGIKVGRSWNHATGATYAEVKPRILRGSVERLAPQIRAALQDGQDTRAIARRFGVSVSSVQKLRQRMVDEAVLSPLPGNRGQPLGLQEAQEVVNAYLAGERVTELARRYHRHPLTIYAILKGRRAIPGLDLSVLQAQPPDFRKAAHLNQPRQPRSTPVFSLQEQEIILQRIERGDSKRAIARDFHASEKRIYQLAKEHPERDPALSHRRLGEDQVRDLYQAIKQGEPVADVARRFEVSYTVAYLIGSGKTWVNVTGAKSDPGEDAEKGA